MRAMPSIGKFAAPPAAARYLCGALLAMVLGLAPAVRADAPPDTPVPTPEPPDTVVAEPVTHESWAIHGQFTYVNQADSSFNAPYAGPNSLTPDRDRETADASLVIGAGLWRGAQIWIDEEIDQGFGLDNTLGVAGFPSAEAFKVGANRPYFRLPRLFVRQILESGGERETVEPTALWLGGDQSTDRWVFTVGKFGVNDIFDVNQYAHDPRGDFLNWAAVDGGAYDYAADAWGFTVGAAAERYQGSWTARLGVFDLSNVPNSAHLDPGFHEFQIDAELEHRHEIDERPGKLLLTLFDSRGRMALLDQALALAASSGMPIQDALVAVRAYRSRLGGVFGIEQELAPDLGFFARYSKAAGNVETYEYTDIDRSIEAGLSLKGGAWHRAWDTVGLALMDNGISAQREQYLNAGGLGVLIGDGKLPHPGPEEAVETYYSVGVNAHAQVSFDFQRIINPAYNRDRGPVSVFAVRVHGQF